MEENEDLKEMTPYQYFQFVKSKVNEMNDKDLNKLYSISSELLEKYKKTGQIKAAKKLAFHIKSILKEKNDKTIKIDFNEINKKKVEKLEEIIEEVI